MSKEIYQGSNSRLAGYIDIRIGQETIHWARSIKPNDYERAMMVNTVLDLYHTTNIYDLTRLTIEIDRKNKPRIKDINFKSLSTRVTEGYNQILFNDPVSEQQSTQDIIRKLISEYKVANSLGATRLDFSEQMETFGNYCGKLFDELTKINKDGERIEPAVANNQYL